MLEPLAREWFPCSCAPEGTACKLAHLHTEPPSSSWSSWWLVMCRHSYLQDRQCKSKNWTIILELTWWRRVSPVAWKNRQISEGTKAGRASLLMAPPPMNHAPTICQSSISVLSCLTLPLHKWYCIYVEDQNSRGPNAMTGKASEDVSYRRYLHIHTAWPGEWSCSYLPVPNQFHHGIHLY